MGSEKIDITPADPLQLAWKELSDLGNADRLVARTGGRLLHVDGRGWTAFADTHWSAEKGEVLAARQAHAVARAIREEIAALKEAIEQRRLPPNVSEEMAKDRLVNLYKWAVTSGNANKTAAMLSQAANLVPATREDFDREPLALNVLNGTLRAERGADGHWALELAPHDPNDMLSRVADVEYHPKAECPEWDRHLATVLPDADVRRFFQTIIGYSLTGLRTEQCIVLLQGKGGDGKSTTMNAIREILGGYAAAADVQTFMAGAVRSGADASPDLARLSGDVRLCSTGEPRRGGQLDEAKVKAITGGSPIAARELHGDLFEYVPRFLLVLECNAKPRISGDDDGIWRRILVIMFPHQFDERKGGKPDKRILERLMGERSGILNWALQGMLAWLEAGELVAPQPVVDAVEDYRRAANPFGEWFHERVDTRDPNILTLAGELFDDYKEWCELQGVGDRDLLNSTSFGRRLGDLQILKGPKDAKGRIRRRGASLRPKTGDMLSSAPAAAAARPFAPPTAFDQDDEP